MEKAKKHDSIQEEHMDIYDKTAELAVSIRESKIFSEFIKTKAEVEMTPQARDILSEYHARQFAMELADMAGEDNSSVSDALAEICEVMEGDALLSRYLRAELDLFHMMHRIRAIFAEKLEMTDGDEEEEYESIDAETNIYFN